MRVRAIDNATGDWLFGKGANDYRVNNDAVTQNINTRLNSFLGDCFFDQGAGINWFNLLGAKDQTALNLAISTVILNTPQVVRILQLAVSLSDKRRMTVTYRVLTSYSVSTSGFVFDTSIAG